MRHVDAQRLGYASMYGGLSVIAGVGALLGSVPPSFKVAIFAALAGYSLFQFLVSAKLSQAYEHNVDHVNALVALSPEGFEAAAWAHVRPTTGMILFGRWAEVRMSRLVPLWYGAAAMLWIALTVWAVAFAPDPSAADPRELSSALSNESMNGSGLSP